MDSIKARNSQNVLKQDVRDLSLRRFVFGNGVTITMTN
jgi:hypothetical protein